MVRKYKSGDKVLERLIELRHSLRRKEGLAEYMAEVERKNKDLGGSKQELFTEDRDRC